MAKQKVTNSQLNNGVLSRTNGGTSGGTQYYINLGGIKMVWGITNSVAIPTATSTTFTIDFPTSFFTTVQSCILTPTGGTSANNQFLGIVGNTAVTTSSVNCYMISTPQTNNNGSTPISYMVIGT